MDDQDTRAVVSAYYAAVAAADIDRVAGFLADDIDWISYGPVHVFPFAGMRRGKQAVAESYRVVFATAEIRRYGPEELVVEGDLAAAIVAATVCRRHSGVVISHRMAHFVRVEHGKLAMFRGFTDTFDLAEQILGRPIDVGPGPGVA